MPFYATTDPATTAMTEGPLDICKFPVLEVPVPMPFENEATFAMADGCPVAFFMGMPACNMISMIELSEDDEEGIEGGLISETIMELVMIDDGSPVLLIEGLPAVDMGISMTMHNLENAVGMFSIPGQTVATGA